jgi:hypothetical protein
MKRKKIQIQFKDGGISEFTDGKEAEFQTAVGLAGELILYRITLHAMLSARTQPEVWKVWAAGTWEHMVHTEVEVDEAD